jgi:dTDP-4-dehydrorhamnose 3,5-epimerase
MKIMQTPIAGVVIIETTPFIDKRGSFSRLFCEDELGDVIGPRRIVQINQSRTNKVGAVRGMHYQHPPNTEMKFIRCIRGRVWDVAIDLRAGSPTFLEWHAEELTWQNTRMIAIPEGCAHGFQVLEADSELLYLHTEFYSPENEGGVAHDEQRVAITWPLPVIDISERDLSYPSIPANFLGIKV